MKIATVFRAPVCACLWNASLLSVIVKFYELDTVPDKPGKMRSQLRNCLRQIGLRACLWAVFFDCLLMSSLCAVPPWAGGAGLSGQVVEQASSSMVSGSVPASASLDNRL